VSSALSKEEIVSRIAHEIGVESPRMSTGSTEPREIFDLVDEVFGLKLVDRFAAEHGRSPTKQDLARLIVNASGSPWLPKYESRGGTVTRQGLLAVLRAVNFFRYGFSEKSDF
jgi:hypothetical protein